MTNIVNQDKLILKLTDFGLSRIAYAVSNPTANLNITKIKLGSGDNNEYYEPDSSQTGLKGDLGLEFYIYDKNILEDKITISFHTIFPEEIGGFDIREVGLYETYEGTDRLFAISTQQPFVKPSIEDNYFICVDYYIFLKEQNLASVYDQITLDIEHALVTDTEMEELMRTFLFAQSNLAQQIGNNSTIIGYNRATQLYEKIEENKRAYSYITLYKNFASLLDIVTSPNNIFSYWVFDYSRRKEQESSIIDLSNNGYYLSTNIPVSNLKRTYKGFNSMFQFAEPNYFSLSSQIPLNLFNPETNSDIPFSMIFVVEPLKTTENRTLLAKSDYALNAHTLEVTELTDRSIQVKLFSDSDNYLTFKTVAGSVPTGAHVIVLTYSPEFRVMTFYIDSSRYVVKAIETGENYTHISETPSTLYAFRCAPSYTIYADSEANPTKLYYKDDTNNFVAYSGTEWTIEDDKIYYNENEATLDSTFGETDLLYGWIPETSLYDKIVYTKELPSNLETMVFSTFPQLYNENYEPYTGEDFTIVANMSGDTIDGYIIQFVRDGDYSDAKYDVNYNIEPITVYGYTYIMDASVIYTNNDTTPTVLYVNEDGKIVSYSGTEWTIENNKIYRLGQEATRSSGEDITTNVLDLVPYIIDSSGNPSEFIDSNVGLISIIKEGLSESNAKILTLNLCATLGKNPYFGGS